MAATNAQQAALSASNGFKAQVRASIMKKSLAIIENQGSYTAAQIARAKSICQGQALDFVNSTIVTDIAEAALDSQVNSVIFVDLV